MSKIEIEITDDNAFNEGWLKYVLGMERPEQVEVKDDGEPVSNAGPHGWDMAKETPALKQVRYVFTRQNDQDHPQYIVREVLPDKVMTKTKVVVE